MTETTGTSRGMRNGAASVTLFACLFAAQAALIAMSPVLADVASDLRVSTAAAGQLRTISGLAAGVTALILASVAGRAGLRGQLLAAAALLAAGSAASAAAPCYAWLALAQVPIGVAVAVLTTAGTLAAAEWTAPERRAQTLSWALVGQPAAWIVGMPLVGLLGERSWRYGWIALPLAAAVAAGFLVASRPGNPAARRSPSSVRAAVRDRTLARWAASELLAGAAWGGTLVYCGALFTESYGASTGLTGCLLALAAGAVVAGNLVGRRLINHDPRRTLIGLAALLALADTLVWLARVHVAVSAALLAVTAFLAGGRTVVTSAFALATNPGLRPAVTSLRAATMQLGYFAGSLAGGAALARGGLGALGPVFGLLFVGAAALLARRPSSLPRLGVALPPVYRAEG